MDSFTFEDAPLPQNISGPPLPTPSPPWPADETFPAFSAIILGIPFVQAEHKTLPSPPAARGAFTPIPSDDGAINCDPSYGGVAGVGSWVTGGQRSPTVVHAMPPVSSTQCVSSPRKAAYLGTTQPVPSLLPVPRFPLGWIRVPQKDYDHGRKQRGFKPLEPIFFSTNGCPGMNLRDALHKEFTGLDGRDDPMLQDAAGSISCRLLVGRDGFFHRSSRADPSEVSRVSG